ncbi:hypothetical protein DFH09DRAFT_1105587 [Mycena vulgaris]|nr:hypothetical protein DFH09DRAFT_1105587 [Mycena vulgaris]
MDTASTATRRGTAAFEFQRGELMRRSAGGVTHTVGEELDANDVAGCMLGRCGRGEGAYAAGCRSQLLSLQDRRPQAAHGQATRTRVDLASMRRMDGGSQCDNQYTELEFAKNPPIMALRYELKEFALFRRRKGQELVQNSIGRVQRKKESKTRTFMAQEARRYEVAAHPLALFDGTSILSIPPFYHHHPDAPRHSRRSPTRSMADSTRNSAGAMVVPSEPTAERPYRGIGPTALNKQRIDRREFIRAAKKAYSVAPKTYSAAHGTAAVTLGPTPPSPTAVPPPQVPHSVGTASASTHPSPRGETPSAPNDDELPDTPNDTLPPAAIDVAAYLDRICSIHWTPFHLSGPFTTSPVPY